MKQKKQILLRVFFIFPITVTRLLNSYTVPLYVYLYSACQIGTSQSTLNWSF